MKFKAIWFLFFLICITYIVQVCSAQKANFRHYSVESGLPQSTVYDLMQDSFGFIWMGTQAGAAMFDGNTFKVFDKRNGLADNHVTAIFQDKYGYYWFGHRYGSITRWDGKNFIHLDAENGFKNEHWITDFFQDAKGNIWVASKGGGIFIVDPVAAPVIYVNLATAKDGLSSDYVNVFCEDENKLLWIGTENGIMVFDPLDTDKGFRYLTNEFEFLATDIKGIEKDDKGRMWIISSTGLLRTERQNSKLKFENININDLPISQFNDIHISKHSKVWVASDEGVAVFDMQGKSFKWFTKKEGLSNNRALSLTEDSEGNMWIGTSGGGICQYLGNKFEIIDESSGIVNNQVLSVLADKDKNLWLGTHYGVSKVTFYDNIMHRIKDITNIDETGWLINNRVYSIYQDSKGMIWFGTNKGVNMLDPVKGKPVSFSNIITLQRGAVRSISEDKNGKIWLCGLESGCSVYDPNSKKFSQILQKDGLSSKKIWTVFRDSKNNLWIGTDDDGIAVYDGENFTKIGKEQGLDNMSAGSVSEDKRGDIWVATIGGGVFRFSMKDGILAETENYSTSYKGPPGSMPLTSDNPYFVFCDNEWGAWIGTNSGIDLINSRTDKIKHFGSEDGFTGIECNQNSNAKDSIGNLWFGTINGVIRYNPSDDKPNEKEPEIYISGVRLFYDKMIWEASIKNYSSNSETIILPHYNNHLTFDYTGLCFSNPQKVRYIYKLDGFDINWSPETKQNFITYPNIPPGEYTFMVEACNNERVWSKQSKTIRIIITPPFWRTWWFYLISALTCLFLIYGIIKLRIKKLRKEKHELEKKVKRRTLEIAMQKKEIYLNHKALEKTNMETMDSIRYARIIQEAILSGEENLKGAFKDSFVLNSPRDIVSGDFCWFFEKTGNRQQGAGKSNELLSDENSGLPAVFLAVADCTGHGVPAAFMSLIGNNLLDIVAGDKNITTPNNVLTIVDQKMRKVLRQTGDFSETYEGMDIALCAFNPHKNLLRFSGALRPLYLVRNGELMIFRATTQPVGGYFEGEKKFVLHEIPLQKDDRIYLFSDGYADQFGRDNGKKYMKKQFDKLLIDIHENTMQEQKKILLKEFNNWKGDTVQLDDVLVIGIKI